MSVKVICIDDSARPNEVPISRWIKKEAVYHLTKLVRMNQQGGIAGVKLAEVNNDDLYPYTYFRASRFALPADWQELVKTGELEEEFV
jgi:hypothetical protein